MINTTQSLNDEQKVALDRINATEKLHEKLPTMLVAVSA